MGDYIQNRVAANWECCDVRVFVGTLRPRRPAAALILSAAPIRWLTAQPRLSLVARISYRCLKGQSNAAARRERSSRSKLRRRNGRIEWTFTSSLLAHSESMVIFKCPYCRTEYELTTARLSFRQRSYAKCHVCHRTMYSWTSRKVPLFTPVDGVPSRGEG